MKRKPDPLIERLRRPATLPRGLRASTLKRLGLRPATPLWQRWSKVLAPFAVAAVAVWVLVPQSNPLRQSNSAPPLHEPSAALLRAQAQVGHQVITSHLQVLPGEPAFGSAPAESASQAGVTSAYVAAPSPLGSGQPLNLAPDPQNGASAREPASSIKITDTPYRYTVRNNRLRPAMGEHLRVELHAAKAGRVHARIFDSLGRPCITLADLDDPHGSIQLDWDGRLGNGQPAPSGAYVLVVVSPDKTEKTGILILR